jgi:2-amino-4-hydroxy-6-hydroxymethyldihydropteridine diphosphokinase
MVTRGNTAENSPRAGGLLAALSLGSNMPFNGMEPPAILAAACARLAAKLRGFRASSVYRTKPLYYRAQDDFYNMACCGLWAATESPRGAAHELLRWTQEIEAAFGRDRTREIPKGPRALDIDIALLGGEVVSTPALSIPHPRLCERAFVLVPLLEILPECADPISGALYRTFLDDIGATGVELLYGNRL